MKRKSILIIAALSLLGGADGRAAVNVLTETGEIVESAFDPATGRWNIIFRSTDAAAPTEYIITADNNDRIGYVRVRASNPGQVSILRIKGAGGQPLLQSVDVIERESGSSDVWLRELETTDDVGDIRVTTLVDAHIGGDLVGNVDLLLRTRGGESSIINLTVSGDVLGDIRTPFGSIFDLTVHGRLGAPGAGNESVVSVRNQLTSLLAGDINAHIRTVTLGFPGFTGRIEVSDELGGGEFSGSLLTNTFYGGEHPGLFVDGEMNADVLISASHNVPGAEIILPVGGLTRQIMINRDNDDRRWNAPIKIGPDGHPDQIVLTGPGYTTKAADLGGGAVGVAPFDLHRSSCDPPHDGAALTPDASLKEPVVVRHYGPVTWQEGSAPLVIERRPLTGGAWQDVTGNCAFAGASQRREILITGAGPGARPFRPDFEYRIRPVRSGPGALRSAVVVDEPLVVVDDPSEPGYEYRFHVEAGESTLCASDLDGDGQVNSADLAWMLGAWGACPAGCSSDLDGDGIVGSGDLAQLLGAWGPCQ